MAISVRKKILSVITVLAIIFTSGIILTGNPMQANAKTDSLITNDLLKKPSEAGMLKIAKVSGKQVLCDKKGEPIQLRGMSTHGLQWYPEILNDNAFDALSTDWRCNVIRLAMYVGENGYAKDPTLKDKIVEGIKLAKKHHMYAIVDWHVLTPGDPTAAVYSGAEDFFKEIAKEFPNDPYIIYEICNEPNSGNPGVSNDAAGWKKVKGYAEKIITELRKAGNENLVLVGSPNWSQRVDLAADDPIADSNTAYTVHFYSGTHKPCDNANDRENVMSNVRYALNKGICVFASEFGTTNADGTGDCDLTDCDTWLRFLNENNISWCNWSLCNKGESSAAFKSFIAGKQEKTNLDPGSLPWEIQDLTISGEYIRARIRGIKYKPIDRTKKFKTIKAFKFNGSAEGFVVNRDSTVKLNLQHKYDSLLVSGFGKSDLSEKGFWSNGRISADNAPNKAKIDIRGATKMEITVVSEKPSTVSIAAIPQSDAHGWTNPDKAVIVTPDDFEWNPEGGYKATVEISDNDAPNLKQIATEKDGGKLSNVILFVGSDAPQIRIDDISFVIAQDLPKIEDHSSQIGNPTFPTKFDDGTRDGWAFDGASGVQGDLTSRLLGKSNVLMWQFEYPPEKPQDNWATAPRLVLTNANIKRGANRYLAFNLFLEPHSVNDLKGGISVNLAFAPPELGYWAQCKKTYDIDLSTIKDHAYLGDGLYYYQVVFDLDDIADQKVLKPDTLLRDITLVFADNNSNFKGEMGVDNIKLAKTLEQANEFEITEDSNGNGSEIKDNPNNNSAGAAATENDAKAKATTATGSKKVANPKTGAESGLPGVACALVISLAALTAIEGIKKNKR